MTSDARRDPATLETTYEHVDTRELVRLVDEAAALIRNIGETAFGAFRARGSRWRRDEHYVFVLDTDGDMLVHPDPAVEGRNQLDLVDVQGKGIVRGLIEAATRNPAHPCGWFHYQWPVPGGLLPRWKSSYARLVTAPSGMTYVVASGLYNDRMERPFVVDMVRYAVTLLEKYGRAVEPMLRDGAGPFLVKDAYVFVTSLDGIELINPAFPCLEDTNLLEFTDTEGRHVVRDMIALVREHGAGWVDYMWPRPGESVPARKSAYVVGATMGGRPVIVGCGVHLADAPKAAAARAIMTVPELVTLVRDAAARLAERGEAAFGEFRVPGSRWRYDDVYLFALTEDGHTAFHGAHPEFEGRDERGLTDVAGRHVGRMILEAAADPWGEGWLHYQYPEPGTLFPAWKSSFVKRARLPDGTRRIVGCGVFHMQMDRAFIEDLVDRAAALLAREGRHAFPRLRDRTGPFMFMDTYVFVSDPFGWELVNGAFPMLEGRNLLDLHDAEGELVVGEEVAAAMANGRAWLECRWYRPGSNVPARRRVYVRKAETEDETFVVGSGFYEE